MNRSRTFRAMARRTAGVAAAALIVAGCQSGAKDNQKQTLGTILGAGVGALAGSQFGGGKGKLAAVAVGALAGAWLGGELGKSLDAADRAYMERNTQDGLEYSKNGTKTTWKNPDSGHSGTITPKQTYRKADGQYCREFEQTVYVDGKEEAAVGRACRQPDGTWKIVG
ncbi:MAG: RT0821/Lpp0805 family surface protein [Magnetovibrio sp.]|nr:RT0821/Lpp0805 family surface protein [Magnetovibrio sp.]